MEAHGRAPIYRSTRTLREPTVNQVCLWIEHGRLDGGLAEIEAAIAARHAARKEKLEADIKDVYGPDAQIVVAPPRPEEPKSPNTMLCGAENGGVPTCGPASDCPHGPRERVGW